MRLVEAIARMGEVDPDAFLVEVLGEGRAPERSYRYREVLEAVSVLQEWLIRARREAGRPISVGLVMANSPEWLVTDLALLVSGAVEVPVPLSFSAEQACGLLSEVDFCLVDALGERRLREWARAGVVAPSSRPVEVDALLGHGRSAPLEPVTSEDFICKIIHTSGTTGSPKGVKIRAYGLSELVASLRRSVPRGAYARYLSLAPLSLLIEQVTAIYMTLSDGGTVVFLPPESPLLGDPGTSARALLRHVPRARPSAMTLPPSVVEAIDRACRSTEKEGEPLYRWLFGRELPPFLGCGGAPIAKEVLCRLAGRGILVHEGYGLSENSSVVTWNVPGHTRLGTVGRPLPHVEVKLAGDGELLVRSTSLFAGYTSVDPSSCKVDENGWLHTGDLAEIDGEGFVRITGRKKSVIITADGRNVAPAWVESKYRSLDFVEEAVVFGDGLEGIHGLFVVEDGTDLEKARTAIDDFGKRYLSDVERAAKIVVMKSDPDLLARCFTITGRPIRHELWKRLEREIATQEKSCPI